MHPTQALGGHEAGKFEAYNGTEGSELEDDMHSQALLLLIALAIRADPNTGQPSITLNAHKGPVERIVFSHDDGLLATADTEIIIWKLKGTSAEILSKKRNIDDDGFPTDLRSASFTPDGNSLAWVNAPGTNVRLWRFSARPTPAELTLAVQSRVMQDVAISPNGELLAAAGGTQLQVHLWNIAVSKPKRVALLGGYRDAVSLVAFSPDSKTLASLAGETVNAFVLVTWDLASRKIVRKIRLPFPTTGPLAYSEDGSALFVVGNLGESFFLKCFDATSGMEKKHLVFSGHKHKLREFSFGPKMDTIASGDLGGHLALWETATAKKIRHWTFRSEVRSAAFSHDGRWLAVGKENGEVSLLPIVAN